MIDLMCKDRKVRIETVRNSHKWFFHFYFAHYIHYQTAPFQHEMFDITEDGTIPLASITAFRDSGKSTIMNTSYPLWAIIGKQQKKFVLMVGQTQQQARQHLRNIKSEAENNDLLKRDLGPLRSEEGEGPWNASSLYLEKYGARIMAVSADMSVRGLRHGEHRPDLIIVDDIEDLASTKTLEGRDKIYQWVKSELLPAGTAKTRSVFIGNLLHEDCLLRRLQQEITDGVLSGTFREFPLLREDGTCLWPDKFPDAASIEAEQKRIGNNSAWYREYLLQILPDADRLIQRQWIQKYENLPQKARVKKTATGVDLAISKSSSADYTAAVSAREFEGDDHIYILPNPINERLSPMETYDRLEQLSTTLGGGRPSQLFIEEVAYQGAAIEEMQKRRRIPTKGIKPHGTDKHSRLAMVAHAVQDGTIVFPEHGCEELIDQLVNHGSTRHDDLADAFAMLMMEMLQKRRKGQIGVAVSNPQKSPEQMTPADITMQEINMIAEALREKTDYFGEFYKRFGRYPYA